MDKRRRNRCQFCRFQKCLAVGMVKEGGWLDGALGISDPIGWGAARVARHPHLIPAPTSRRQPLRADASPYLPCWQGWGGPEFSIFDFSEVVCIVWAEDSFSRFLHFLLH